MCLAFQLVFAILGMQLFMGTFGSCSDSSITLQALYLLWLCLLRLCLLLLLYSLTLATRFVWLY